MARSQSAAVRSPGAGGRRDERIAWRVTGIPVLTLADVFRRPAPVTLPVPAERASLWYSGRTAIWQGLSCLGLRAGDRVLAPVYACGAEIDPLVQAGLDVAYYRIGPDLAPDLQDLDGLCATPARALLVTHYFGIPQPMPALLSFARARGLSVIEDAAQALYSSDAAGQALGTYGDVGVWTFGKILAVPDGAALIVKDPSRRPASPGVAPSPLRVGARVKWLVELAAGRRYPRLTTAAKRRVLDPLIGGIKRRRPVSDDSVRPASPDQALMAFRREEAFWRMSAIAFRILTRSPSPTEVVGRRRRNYLALERDLAGSRRVAPLLQALPTGCSPQLFPLLASDGESLRAFLIAHGVHAHRFGGFLDWGHPVDRFPVEARLNRELVLLPLHQALAASDMAEVAALVHRWERNAA